VLIRGKCHCGNIAFSLTWEPEPKEIQARVCDCTFCAKHGGVWTSNPKGALKVAVRDPKLVSKYEFGTETAVFHICMRCGIVPVVTSELDGRTYAVVSVNAFEGIDPAIVRKAPVTFEGEALESRLARRRQRWIPDVRFQGLDP
jgi:hypothetical protein